MSRWIALVLVTALVGCGSREVVVKVTMPGLDSAEAPVPGVALVLLPYDRDSIIRALEAKAPTPRPDPGPLDSLFERFRKPFLTYAVLSARTDSLRAALTQLRTELDRLPRNSPDYQQRYAAFGEKTDTLSRLELLRTAARDSLDRTRKRIGPRMDSLRAGMNQWENSTYGSYDSITRSMLKMFGQEPIADTTGPDGTAKLHLGRGRWWVYAKSWDVQDPNRWWYWNVPVTGDTVLLNGRTGQRKPRY